MDDVMKLDLYDILGIPPDSKEPEIKRAYRHKALECHPDKNPDDPNATKLFLQLKQVLAVLIDEKARAAYDQTLKNKNAARQRYEKLDSERKRFKHDLDQREKEAERQSFNERSAQERLQKEIERLRQQGSKDVEEEAARVRQELANEKKGFIFAQKQVHIHWKASKKDTTNGGYNQENLMKIFSKYGDIEVIAMSRKNGSALIEFQSAESAKQAVVIELGYPSNPLKLKLVGDAKKISVTHETSDQKMSSPLFPCAVEAEKSNQPSTADLQDFEDFVLKKMRDAQAEKNAENANNSGE